MIQCEHFVYAMMDGGYRFIGSRKARSLVGTKNVQFICQINEVNESASPRIVHIWFGEEKVISISSIASVKDGYGREGVFNHTILIKIDDYIEHTSPGNILKPYFYKDVASLTKTFGTMPKSLPTLKIE